MLSIIFQYFETLSVSNNPVDRLPKTLRVLISSKNVCFPTADWLDRSFSRSGSIFSRASSFHKLFRYFNTASKKFGSVYLSRDICLWGFLALVDRHVWGIFKLAASWACERITFFSSVHKFSYFTHANSILFEESLFYCGAPFVALPIAYECIESNVSREKRCLIIHLVTCARPYNVFEMLPLSFKPLLNALDLIVIFRCAL